MVVPREQGCCGGLAWHTGDRKAAQAFARRNLAAFPTEVDAILTNAAGCGSAMHEYHLILSGTPDEARAEAFRHRVQDVSLFLAQLGWRQPTGSSPKKLRVAYHDAFIVALSVVVGLVAAALVFALLDAKVRTKDDVASS